MANWQCLNRIRVSNKSRVSNTTRGAEVTLFYGIHMVVAGSDLQVAILYLGLHRISASANSKFGHFSQIRPNSASAKFLAEFGRICQCNCSAFS